MGTDDRDLPKPKPPPVIPTPLTPLKTPWYVEQWSAERPAVTVNSDQVINRQGKDFVLYAGLLDAAHRAGLREIKTSLVQVPGPNNTPAIVHATAVFNWGSFDGIGDADAGNVGRMIVPHIIRMAETRAKARALRDALNVGMVAIEELGPGGPVDDSEESATPHVQAAPAPVPPNRGGGGAAPRRVATPPLGAPERDGGTAPSPASRAAEALKFDRIRTTALRLRDEGKLKVGDEMIAPVADAENAQDIAGRYRRLVPLINQALSGGRE